MKWRIWVPVSALLAMWGLVANAPKPDQLPAGALEKIQQALPSASFAKPQKPRKLLVFAVTRGFRHGSIITGKLALTELGKKTGSFETVVSDDLANFESPAIQQFDAICFLSTTQDVFMPAADELNAMSEEQKKTTTEQALRLRENLMNFIKSGKGFVGIHAATDTLYNWPQYGEMIGGYFDGHPWGAGTDVQIDVEKGQEQHPLAAMFEGKSLNFKEEIYQHKQPYDSSKVTMLLRLNVEKSAQVQNLKRQDGDYGVSWARQWGQGRVFYCSLGHNNEMYWHPLVLKHYLAGIQWAMGDLQATVK